MMRVTVVLKVEGYNLEELNRLTSLALNIAKAYEGFKIEYEMNITSDIAVIELTMNLKEEEGEGEAE